MRNNSFFLTVLSLMALMVFASCEKMVLDEVQEPETATPDGNVSLKIVVNDTRAALSDYWKTLNFVIFQDGAKKKAVTQKNDDSGFGQLNLTLAPGTYQVMVIAHSSNGNPSLSNPENVKFTNDNGFSDTFTAYREIVVESTSKTYELTMTRATSMVRFCTKDVKPAEAKKIRFYYVGGSGAINVLTGLGVDASKQSVLVDLPDELTGKALQFDLYTFVRTEEASLKLTVNVMDGNGDLLAYPGMDEGRSRIFENIPIRKNQITECSGNFFSDSSKEDPGNDPGQEQTCSTSFVVVVNTDWGETIQYAY